MEMERRKLTVTCTDVAFIPPDELHGELVELLKVVAGIGNLPRFKPEPSDTLEDGLKEAAFFRFRVGVVESEIAVAAVVLGVSEINHDRFHVAYASVAPFIRYVQIPFQVHIQLSETHRCAKIH